MLRLDVNKLQHFLRDARLPLLFMSAFCIFASYITKISVYGYSPEYVSTFLFVIGTLLSLAAGFTDNSIADKNNYLIIGGIILVSLSLLLGLPQGGGLLVCGIFLILHNFKYSFTLLHASIFYSLSIVITLFMVAIMPTYHEFNGLTKLVSSILNIMENASTYDGNIINTVIEGSTYSFAVTYEQSGLWWIVAPLISVLYLTVQIPNKKDAVKTLLVSLVSLFGYFIVRYIALIYIYTILKDITIFYSLTTTFLSWIPWFGIYYFLIRYFKLSFNHDIFIIELTGKKIIRNLSIMLLLAINLSILIIGIQYTPSTIKNGKIYIDEFHSYGWESVSEPLNTELYLGQKSTYTYYSFVEYLQQLGDTEVIDELQDYDRLTSEDILIIKTPTVDMEPELVEKIQTFVNQGGGLFLIGDHTNLFDMNRRLNEISAPMGLEFRYDAAYNLQSTNLTNYDSQYNDIYLSPINTILDEYKFATSCTIKSNILSQKVIVGNNLASENLDMSHANFFGDLSLSETEMFGLFEQCTALNYGQGRVVAFSDSTTFSSYSVFLHDNPEFIISIIDYLNQKNTFNFTLLLGVIIFLCNILFIVISNRKKLYTFKFIIPLFIVTIPLSICISNMILGYAYEREADRVNHKLNSLETVFFVRDPDENELSHFVSMGQNKGQYSSLFLAFQRLGYFPRETKDLHEAIAANTSLLVITDPSFINHNDLHYLDSYLMHGGEILFTYKENSFDDFEKVFDFFKIQYTPVPFTTEIQDIAETEGLDYLHYIEYMPTGYPAPEMYKTSNVHNIRLDTYELANGKINVLFSLEYFDNVALGDPGEMATQAQLNQHAILHDLLDQAGWSGNTN